MSLGYLWVFICLKNPRWSWSLLYPTIPTFADVLGKTLSLVPDAILICDGGNLDQLWKHRGLAETWFSYPSDLLLTHRLVMPDSVPTFLNRRCLHACDSSLEFNFAGMLVVKTCTWWLLLAAAIKATCSILTSTGSTWESGLEQKPINQLLSFFKSFTCWTGTVWKWLHL